LVGTDERADHRIEHEERRDAEGHSLATRKKSDRSLTATSESEKPQQQQQAILVQKTVPVFP
jgi:hypothetical protein